MMDTKTIWQGALDSEIGFWDHWMATKGSQWPDDFTRRLDPALPLQEDLLPHVASFPEGSLEILDVGAGPMTVLGKRTAQHHLHITAVDPLADAYDRLLEKHQIQPLVRTTWCHGELLDQRFKKESFHLVFSQNALDHSYDPIAIFRNMLTLVRKDGVVVLKHAFNEGEKANYEGLHQWNFSEEEGGFVVWNRYMKQNITRMFEAFAHVQAGTSGAHLFVVMRPKAG